MNRSKICLTVRRIIKKRTAISMKKRILSIMLVLCLCAALLPTTAMATSKTADEAIEWVKSQVGHSVGYDDGSGYYQCVEFIQAYYQWLGVDKVSGNGADYATNALPSGWTRTAAANLKRAIYLSIPGTHLQYNNMVTSQYTNPIMPYMIKMEVYMGLLSKKKLKTIKLTHTTIGVAYTPISLHRLRSRM